MLLTDVDISDFLDKEIVIEPFEDTCLTPVGYNFRVGDFVFSLERGLLECDSSGRYAIKPGETILILTKEFLWVSDRIGGTFHSKVKLTSKGFSHISTTLDPSWNGPLLISISNLSKKTLSLSDGEAFVTLLFYLTRSRSRRPHNNPSARRDILFQLFSISSKTTKKSFQANQIALVEKVGQIVNSVEVKNIFSEKVSKANEKGITKVFQAYMRQERSIRLHYTLVFLHVIALLLVILLPAIFNRWLITIFPNVVVDTEFLMGDLGAAIIIITSLFNLLNKKQ